MSNAYVPRAATERYLDIVFMPRRSLQMRDDRVDLPEFQDESVADDGQRLEMARVRDALLAAHPGASVESHDEESVGFLVTGLGEFEVDVYPDHVLCSVYPGDWHFSDAGDAAFRADVMAPFQALGYAAVQVDNADLLDPQRFRLRDYFDLVDAQASEDARPSVASPKPAPAPAPGSTHAPAPGIAVPDGLAPGEQRRSWWKFW